MFWFYVEVVGCLDLTLDIQTPVEEVFEPPNISWEGF